VKTRDPSVAIDRETAGRDYAVDMRMILQVLSPSVQHTEQSDVGAQVLRVASHFEQRRGTGAEKQVVQQPLVLKDERR